MTLYNNYEYKSPKVIYAQIKEELRSYFETGVIDDLLFPIWTKDCVRQFHKTYYPIKEDVLIVENSMAQLPCDFKKVREAWICTNAGSVIWNNPTADYYVENIVLNCQNDCDTNCPENTKSIVRKVIGFYEYSYNRQYRLKPGNRHTMQYCADECTTLNSSCPDTFDIRGDKMLLSFTEGTVSLVYYSDPENEEGEVLIPDSYYFEDYLRKYLKWQLFIQIFHQTTDESFQQSRNKMEMYEQQSINAFIAASNDSKKETLEQKVRSIIKQRKSLDRYGRKNRW